MSLRHKIGLVALLHVIFLTANVVVCAGCMLKYYQFLLNGLSGSTGPAVSLSLAGTGQEHADILPILLANAACSIAMLLVGLRLVRHWVARPIAELKAGALRIAAGDFQHPVPVSSNDELGQLAAQVNAMASTVLAMQQGLIEQERRATAARALRCIVHNIRSPLTGIRWLAEALSSRAGLSQSARSHQLEVMSIVDSILDWLAQYRHLMTDVSIQATPLSEATLFNDLGRSIHRRNPVCLRLSTTAEIIGDPTYLRPALEAMLSAVAGAACPGEAIDVLARDAEDQRHCRLIIRPHGCASMAGDGSSSRVIVSSRGQEFSSLAAAERIMRLHGGVVEIGRDSIGHVFVDITLPTRH